MSDTPRMKAAQMTAIEHLTGDVYRVGCDIEQQLNAANDRIKRLEDAGDAVAAIIGPPGSAHWADENQVDAAWNNWTKAKEAKP